MPVTPVDIVNQAIFLIGNNQGPVTGNAPNFDSTPAGVAAAKLYAPCVQTIGRQFGWDFARTLVVLTPSGNTAPFPWLQEYLYPTNGIQVWQVVPGTVDDLNNPLPTNWVVANVAVSGVQTKVIQTNAVGALAIYNNNPGPDVWDPGFREAVVRLLASEMAMALGGKPDTAAAMLDSANAFEQAAEGRED